MLSIKMRLTLFTIDGDDPKRWFMKAIRHSGFTSRILNINKIFADAHIGDFKDRSYMEEAVIPRLLQVIDSQQPMTAFFCPSATPAGRNGSSRRPMRSFC